MHGDTITHTPSHVRHMHVRYALVTPVRREVGNTAHRVWWHQRAPRRAAMHGGQRDGLSEHKLAVARSHAMTASESQRRRSLNRWAPEPEQE